MLKKNIANICLAAGALVSLLPMVVTGSITESTSKPIGQQPAKNLNFRVFLDANEIGYHKVLITPTGDGETINVQAKFDVKFLFFTAFSYLHEANEQWQGRCLTRIDADTTENGDKFFVRSEPRENGLEISSHKTETSLDGCIRSFAYWDVERLFTDRLLNTQTGEYVPASITALGDKDFELDGTSYLAKQYVLRAENADINLWYSQDNEWLALKTKVKGGRVLAYYRTENATEPAAGEEADDVQDI